MDIFGSNRHGHTRMVAETSLQLRKKCKMPTGSCHDYDQEEMRRSRRTSGCTLIDRSSLQENYLSWRAVRLGGKTRANLILVNVLIFAC